MTILASRQNPNSDCITNFTPVHPPWSTISFASVRQHAWCDLGNGACLEGPGCVQAIVCDSETECFWKLITSSETKEEEVSAKSFIELRKDYFIQLHRIESIVCITLQNIEVFSFFRGEGGLARSVNKGRQIIQNLKKYALIDHCFFLDSNGFVGNMEMDGWQSSSHLALKPINLSIADLESEKRNRDIPFGDPLPVSFLPVWKDEISQVVAFVWHFVIVPTILICAFRCIPSHLKLWFIIRNQHLMSIFQKHRPCLKNHSQWNRVIFSLDREGHCKPPRTEKAFWSLKGRAFKKIRY